MLTIFFLGINKPLTRKKEMDIVMSSIFHLFFFLTSHVFRNILWRFLKCSFLTSLLTYLTKYACFYRLTILISVVSNSFVFFFWSTKICSGKKAAFLVYDAVILVFTRFPLIHFWENCAPLVCICIVTNCTVRTRSLFKSADVTSIRIWKIIRKRFY